MTPILIYGPKYNKKLYIKLQKFQVEATATNQTRIFCKYTHTILEMPMNVVE